MDDIETQSLIDSISSSFCAAKWYNATIWLGSGMTTSCHHPLPHKIDPDAVRLNPKLLHNTPEKKHQRKQMLVGERPAGCEYCWKLEDAGSRSDRIYKTKIYSKEDVLAAACNSSNDDVDLRTLEISFDRTCNFACSYCNPAFSTTWAKDINQKGPYVGLVTDGRNHFTHPHNSSQLYKLGEDNPYIEAFFKWWESDLHKTLIELRITGGEPLMSADFWRLADWFVHNKSNVRLAINTNLGAKDQLIDRLIMLSRDVPLDIYTSCEAVGARAEYIRDGLDWRQWTTNMERLVTHGNLRGLHVMSTPSVLSIMDITKFLDWCYKFKLEHGKDFPVFTLNILRFPSFQSITMLPQEMKDAAALELETWLTNHRDDPLLHGMEIDHVSRLANYLRTVQTPHENASEKDLLKKDLKNFLEQHDIRRGKDLDIACPEIASWLSGA